MDTGGEFKYWAFISYSHRDKAWGDWLHKTLETFRTPARLAGRPSRDGTVPKRLYPVFRDRDELPSSANLGDNIDAALRESRYLIVICSPTAAVSRWVDGEIRSFKKLGRADRVLCLVVDGEPNATDRPESGELECFPPSLRYTVDAGGNLTPTRTEPIAADARSGKDGRANARLKILAGLLGVGYDELKQREKQRRLRQRVQWAAAGLALLALLVGGWVYVAQQKNREALAAEYGEQGRQLFTDGKPLQAAVYLSEAYRLGGRSPALRFLLARSMRYVEALKATVPVAGIYVAADLSPDGRRFLTTSFSETGEVWDSRTAQPLMTLRGKYAKLLRARFSPDGKYIAGSSKPETVSDDAAVDVWDGGSGKLLYSLSFPGAFVVRAVFDDSGRRMLTRDERQNLVQMWETATGKELFHLPAMKSVYKLAALSPDGRHIVTVQYDNSVHIWDGATGAAEHVLRGHTAEVTNFSFSQDSRLLATVSKDMSAQVWDLTTGARIAKIARKNPEDYEGGHSDEVNDAEFTPDGKRLITAGKDKMARLWDVATGKLVSELGRMNDEVASVSVSRDGRYAAVSSKDSVTWLWDLRDDSMRAVLRAGSADFLPDGGTLLAIDGPDGAVQMWDVAALGANRGIEGGAPVFSPDESRMATVNEDVVNIRDADGKLLKAIQLPPDPKHPEDKTYAGDVEWSPDGARLMVEHADSDYMPGVWDAAGRPIAVFKQGLRHADTASFTPDGKRVYLCGSDVNAPPAKRELDARRSGRVGQVWDVAGARVLASFSMPDGCVDNARFDAAGTRMAGSVVAYPSQHEFHYHVELWDLAAGRRIAKLPGYVQGYHDDVAFSPDKSELLTGTDDGVVHVWDPATGAEKRHWDTHGSPPEALFYSPDGRSLLTGHLDGTVRVWDAASLTPRWQVKVGQVDFGSVVYSPDGAFVLLNTYREPPRVLDASSGALLMELPGDTHLIENSGYSPRGDYFSTFSYDAASARLWDMHLEQRDAAVLSAEVGCRVPWRLQAGQLVPATAGGADCGGER